MKVQQKEREKEIRVSISRYFHKHFVIGNDIQANCARPGTASLRKYSDFKFLVINSAFETDVISDSKSDIIPDIMDRYNILIIFTI